MHLKFAKIWKYTDKNRNVVPKACVPPPLPVPPPPLYIYTPLANTVGDILANVMVDLRANGKRNIRAKLPAVCEA